ncbi:MAG: hypothetical protein ABSA42_17585 [Terracidiphilus sp.]|jgi:nitrate reductase alpha subunit
MKDLWYGDKRDLVKWGTLIELARRSDSKHILQVVYYDATKWEKISIDTESAQISDEVIRHFRDVDSIRGLKCGVAIELLKDRFAHKERGDYLRYITSAIHKRKEHPGVVFLDPDTGLEPQGQGPGPKHVCKAGPKHVCELEVAIIWAALSAGDLLVLYQHQDNRAGNEWKDRKRRQFAEALGARESEVKMAFAEDVASDVAFYFVKKN